MPLKKASPSVSLFFFHDQNVFLKNLQTTPLILLFSLPLSARRPPPPASDPSHAQPQRPNDRERERERKGILGTMVCAERNFGKRMNVERKGMWKEKLVTWHSQLSKCEAGFPKGLRQLHKLMRQNHLNVNKMHISIIKMGMKKMNRKLSPRAQDFLMGTLAN